MTKFETKIKQKKIIASKKENHLLTEVIEF